MILDRLQVNYHKDSKTVGLQGFSQILESMENVSCLMSRHDKNSNRPYPFTHIFSTIDIHLVSGSVIFNLEYHCLPASIQDMRFG